MLKLSDADGLAALRQECEEKLKPCADYWTGTIGINDVLDAIVPLLLRERQARAQAWQPMETAPKDGTTVIGYDIERWTDDDYLNGVEFMRFIDGAWLDPLTHTMKPTAWMPLPAAPDASGGKE